MYNMSDSFKTFKENIMFRNIYDAIDENFQKYREDIPHLFILAVVLDLSIKEVGEIFLLMVLLKFANRT